MCVCVRACVCVCACASKQALWKPLFSYSLSLSLFFSLHGFYKRECLSLFKRLSCDLLGKQVCSVSFFFFVLSFCLWCQCTVALNSLVAAALKLRRPCIIVKPNFDEICYHRFGIDSFISFVTLRMPVI